MRAYASIEEAIALGHGTQRVFLCHVHGDTNASARVNALTGGWLCYACGAKGYVDTDKIVVSPDSVVRELQTLDKVINEKPVTYSERWLNLFDAQGPGEYWLSRYNEETCRLYRLGFDPATNAATYPLRDRKGTVLGVVRRSLLDTGPKYLYPYGVDISTLLFDLHRNESDTVILVEGATDAIAVREAGFEAMAIYGSRLSRRQAELLRAYSPNRIIAAFDQDRAGDSAYEGVREQFGVTVERARWDTYKDLSEAPLPTRRLITQRMFDGRQKVRVASQPCRSREQQSPAPRTSSRSSGRLRIVRQTPTGS